MEIMMEQMSYGQLTLAPMYEWKKKKQLICLVCLGLSHVRCSIEEIFAI